MNTQQNKSTFIRRAALLLLTVLSISVARAQTQINEGFEGSTFVPEDWMAIHVSGDKSWERSSGYHYEGSWCAYMAYSKGGNENYLITPQLMPAKKNGTSYNEQIIFGVAAQQYTGTTLQVEVSTTDTKPSSFTPIKIFTTGSSSSSSNNIGSTFLEDWHEKYVTIPDEYIGKPIYIAFHVIDNDGSTIVIDKVSGVSLYLSPYAKPGNLTCSNVTSNAVDLSWNAGGEETSWHVQVVCSNGGDEIINRTMPTKSFTLGGLMPGTDYYVKVRGNYGDDHYSNWSTVKFTTLPLELFDASDNSDFLMSYNGKKVNVTLTDRILYKDGNWNTLCLPFAVTDLSKTPLAGATVMTLQSSSFNNADGTLKLNFANATTIEAGKPYIVKWESGADIANPTFKGVTISNATSPVETDYVDFVGTFSPIDIFTDEKTNLYLGADNVLSYPWGDGMTSFTMNSFRAYFQLADGLNESGNAVKSMNLNFGGEATGIGEIPNIKSQTSAPASWYSLDGRKLSDKPTRKGIYIHNGLKVVIQ